MMATDDLAGTVARLREALAEAGEDSPMPWRQEPGDPTYARDTNGRVVADGMPTVMALLCETATALPALLDALQAAAAREVRLLGALSAVDKWRERERPIGAPCGCERCELLGSLAKVRADEGCCQKASAALEGPAQEGGDND